jgi:outer membrane protein TolC
MRVALAAGIVGAGLAAFAGARAFAQAPAPLADLERVSLLTLDDAMRRTDRASAELASAREQAEQAGVAVRRAWAVVQPRLSATGAYTRNNQEVAVDFGPPAPGAPVPEPAVIQRLNQLSAQVQAEQLLFNGQALPLIRNAYSSRQAAEAQLLSTRRELLARVAEAYFAGLGAEALVGVGERQLALATEQLEVTAARVAAGAALASDELRARIDRLRAENDLARARNALQQARVAVGTLARVQPEFRLAAPETVSVTPPEGATEALVARALAERPEAVVSRLQAEIAGRQREAAWWALAPSLGLSGLLRWANAAGFGPNTVWSVSVNVTVPIYDGGLRYADLAESGSRLREAEAQRVSLERRIAEDIVDARLTLESARAQRENARNSVELARQNVELVFTQYRAGTATRLELADATTALRSAEAEFVRESVQVQLAALRLARSVGTFRPLEP